VLYSEWGGHAKVTQLRAQAAELGLQVDRSAALTPPAPRSISTARSVSRT